MSTVVVDVPANESSGLMLSGSPASVTSSSYHASHVGLYVIAVRLPGVELTGLNDSTAVSQKLIQHSSGPRQVVLSGKAPALSPTIRYTHTLPSNQDLGLTFDGFPAKVQIVDPKSAFARTVQPEQNVLAVLVPGYPMLSFESGGFTGHRVQKHLKETSHCADRKLILQDQPVKVLPKRYQKTAQDADLNSPFDFKGFTGNWFRRR